MIYIVVLANTHPNNQANMYMVVLRSKVYRYNLAKEGGGECV